MSQQGWVEAGFLIRKEDMEGWPVARVRRNYNQGNPIILALNNFSGFTHDYMRKMGGGAPRV